MAAMLRAPALSCLALAAALALALVAQAGPARTPLQQLIDATPTGGVLKLPPGTYAGPATVTRPMTITGGGAAQVDAAGKGTVLTLHASGATLRGLRLGGSGDSHDAIDAGILVEGDDNLVEGNVVEDVLFGIHIKQGERNRVANNHVSGRAAPRGQRGDGLRLWNSRRNRIEDNTFSRVRDLTFANSPDNLIVGNRLSDGRYGMQFVFSPRAQVLRNHLSDTDTGIAVLYSPELVLRDNAIAHALDGGGAGIVFKDSGNALVERNDILHCAAGLSANSPLNEEAALTVRNNRFAHNVVGMYFYGEKGGHRIEANRFENNLTQVAVSAAGVGEANTWKGNAWSDYQGFDRDGNGIGDTPYEIWLYTDRIWMETPRARFFANSPALELLDFLEKLAPFASPALILRDAAPRMAR